MLGQSGQRWESITTTKLTVFSVMWDPRREICEGICARTVHFRQSWWEVSKYRTAWLVFDNGLYRGIMTGHYDRGIMTLPCTGLHHHIYHVSFQWTQNICITFIQCWTNVGDVGPTLYKCHAVFLCLLGLSPGNTSPTSEAIFYWRNRHCFHYKSKTKDPCQAF